MMLWMLLLLLCLWPQCVTPLHGLHVITWGRVTLLLALTQLLLLVLLVCLVDIVWMLLLLTACLAAYYCVCGTITLTSN